MIRSFNNCIFDSMYFLVEEVNKISPHNNLIVTNEYRKIIEKYIVSDTKEYQLNEFLKKNLSKDVTFPLIRRDVINICSEPKDDFMIYFLSGIFCKNRISFKNEVNLLNSSPEIFKYFISQDTKRGSIVFFEDTIFETFQSLHSIVDEKYEYIYATSHEELKKIYYQNTIINSLIRLYHVFLSDFIENNINLPYLKAYHLYDIIDENLLETQYDFIHPEYIDMSGKYCDPTVYTLLVFCALKLYFSKIYNLNLSEEEDENKLDNIMMQVLLTYFYNIIIGTKLIKNPVLVTTMKEKDKINSIEFCKYALKLINKWTSKDFRKLSLECKYLEGFEIIKAEKSNLII